MCSHACAAMLTIAIIEDDAPVRDAVRLVLELEGWAVRAYERGETFLSDLAQNQPDCIILDAHLPGISGAEVARAVAKEALIPILCLTAQPDSAIAREIQRLGARVVLTKPVGAATLIGHVRDALSEAIPPK